MVSSLSRTISVSPPPQYSSLIWSVYNANLVLGLISQVAEDLWEVKDKKVINLTKQDVSIVDYKRQLAKRSESTQGQIQTWGSMLTLHF